MICLEGVSKRFGTVEALAPLDLEIERGEWLGVVGRNGSGKTSGEGALGHDDPSAEALGM